MFTTSAPLPRLKDLDSLVRTGWAAYHDDEYVHWQGFKVQLLGQDENSALGVQVEVSDAAGLDAAMDGVDQPAVDVLVPGVDLQDLLPRSGILWHPHLIILLKEFRTMFVHVQHTYVGLTLQSMKNQYQTF